MFMQVTKETKMALSEKWIGRLKAVMIVAALISCIVAVGINAFLNPDELSKYIF